MVSASTTRTGTTTTAKKTKFSSNVSDPVSDLLTRIRNANTAYKDELVAPTSKLSKAVLDILAHEGDRSIDLLAVGVSVRIELRAHPGVTGWSPWRTYWPGRKRCSACWQACLSAIRTAARGETKNNLP